MSIRAIHAIPAIHAKFMQRVLALTGLANRMSHAPCERQFWAFAWRARRVRSASRCGCRRWIGPRRVARFLNRAQ
eukprot:5957770-Lingulodinium_polyedra.AAC.1